MGKCYHIFLCAVLFLAIPSALLAQRTVPVEQGVGTLNEAIASDTTATGARVDSNTVYVLQSGGIYLLNGSIEHRGYHLSVVAEDGAGERPQLIPAVGEGGVSARPFTPRGDLTLDGLYVTNRDELGGVNLRIIRIRADSVRITINDCHLDSSSQSAFRFDNTGNRVFISNSIISNISGDYNNGRGFDDRGNSIDSLVVTNTTFYNLASRILRDDGGHIKYAKFDHCTVVNTGRRLFEFGEVVDLVLKNNMFIDHSILGATDTTDASIQMDPLTSESVQGLTQTADIRNNNFYRDPSYDAAFPDSARAIALFDSLASDWISMQGTEGTMTNEAIAFTNRPIPNPAMVTAYWQSGEDPTSYAAEPFDVSHEPFDFSYGMNTASYTGSTAGRPLGDLNWFGLATDIDGPLASETPESFSLLENYPNPFNPETNIVYTLPQNSLVKLTIYNVLGQRIRELVNNQLQNPGVHTVRWNGQDDQGRSVSSGMYLYRLEAGSFVQTNKMLLLK